MRAGLDMGGTLIKMAYVDRNEEIQLRQFMYEDFDKMLDLIREESLRQLEQQADKKGSMGIDTINVTGGGAYKYEELLEKELQMKVCKKDEMRSLIRGLQYELKIAGRECGERTRSKATSRATKKNATYGLKTQKKSVSTEGVVEASKPAVARSERIDDVTPPSGQNITEPKPVPSNCVFSYDLKRDKRFGRKINMRRESFLLTNIGSGVSILKCRMKSPKGSERAATVSPPSNCVENDSQVGFESSGSDSGLSGLSQEDQAALNRRESLGREMLQDSEDELLYSRISGTCIGGGTALGLCKLSYGAKSFEEVVELSEQGKDSLDLQVSDLIGDTAGSRLLPSDTLASSFGRLYTNPTLTSVRKQDIATSTIKMISYNIGYLAVLLAQIHKVKYIFFSGKYICDHSFTMKTITQAVTFSSLYQHKENLSVSAFSDQDLPRTQSETKFSSLVASLQKSDQQSPQALFLKHDGFLCAIGALLLP